MYRGSDGRLLRRSSDVVGVGPRPLSYVFAAQEQEIANTVRSKEDAMITKKWVEKTFLRQVNRQFSKHFDRMSDTVLKFLRENVKPPGVPNSVKYDTLLLALQSLGFSKSESTRWAKKVYKGNEDLPVEELVIMALREGRCS